MIVQRMREVKNTPAGIAQIGDIIVINDNNQYEKYTTAAAFKAAYPVIGAAIDWRKDIDDLLDQADADETAITAAQVRHQKHQHIKIAD